jgi:hypothetical protein
LGDLDLGVDERIILKRILQKQNVRTRTRFCHSGYGQVAGSFEHGNDPSGSIRGEEFLEDLNDFFMALFLQLHYLPFISKRRLSVVTYRMALRV